MMLQETPVRMDAAEIAQILGTEIQNAADTAFSVSGFSTDTRTIAPGDCFIALTGEHFNGNLYAKQAAEKGAVLCILSEKPQDALPVPYLCVPDTVKAYGDIANAYLRTRKAAGMKVIAVTGSSGKTTVKDMTAQVLASRFRTYATAGNHNNHIGLPFTILHTPADTEIAVLEMGMNHAGEIRYLSQIGVPDIGMITNIGTAHIGNLGSQENIFRAKLEILDGMDAQSGRLLLPADDAYLARYSEIPFPAEQICYVSRTGKQAALQAVEIEESPDSVCFTAVYRETESAKVTLPMTGLHNVSNALQAMLAGLQCGMTLRECADALADFAPGAMRSERVTIGSCTVIRDYYNANPEAMAASLQMLGTIADGAKKIAVLGNMNELGEFAAQRHNELGALCKDVTDDAFFCGVNAADFAAGYGEAAHAYKSQDDLIAALLQTVSAYSSQPLCILIKGSRGVHMEKVSEALERQLKGI